MYVVKYTERGSQSEAVCAVVGGLYGGINKKKVRESRKGIPPSRKNTSGEGGRRRTQAHTTTTLENLREALLSHHRDPTHTIPTSGSRQAKRCPVQASCHRRFFKTSHVLRHAKGAREGWGEPEYSSFLPQIILQVRSKCSTLPRKEKREDIAKKMNSD